MPLGDLSSPMDLYFLVLIGGILFPASLLALLADLDLGPSFLSGPPVLVLALTVVGGLFLGGAGYLYWTRSRGGDPPFRPWRNF